MTIVIITKTHWVFRMATKLVVGWHLAMDIDRSTLFPKRNASFFEVAFLLGKSVNYIILYQKSFVECEDHLTKLT